MWGSIPGYQNIPTNLENHKICYWNLGIDPLKVGIDPWERKITKSTFESRDRSLGQKFLKSSFLGFLVLAQVYVNNPKRGELDWLQIFSNKIHNKYNWENGNLMNIYMKLKAQLYKKVSMTYKGLIL